MCGVIRALWSVCVCPLLVLLSRLPIRRQAHDSDTERVYQDALAQPLSLLYVLVRDLGRKHAHVTHVPAVDDGSHMPTDPKSRHV